MPIKQLTTNVTGLAGVFPRIVYISTNDTLDEILVPGYLNKAVQEGYLFFPGDVAVVGLYTNNTTPDVSAILAIVQNGVNWSFDFLTGFGTVNNGLMNQLAWYATNGDVISGLPTANSAMLRTNASGVPALSAPMTNGQIMIGATGGTPTPATITAGTGIMITNGANSISISSSGQETWVNQNSSTVTMEVNHGYTINNGASLVTLTLPSTSTYGDSLEINGSSAGGWAVAQLGGQQIRIGSQATTVGVSGSISSFNQYDCVKLRCIVPNNVWTVVAQQSPGINFA